MSMPVTRREFVKIGAMTSAALLLAKERVWAAFAQSPGLQKFMQPMRLFGVNIPLAVAGHAPSYAGRQTTTRSRCGSSPTQLHPTWGRRRCGATRTACSHDGLQAPRRRHRRDGEQAGPRPVGTTSCRRTSRFPSIPPWSSRHMRSDRAMNDRAAPHLHGGLVPWPSDGGPFHWFSNPAANVKGPSVDRLPTRRAADRRLLVPEHPERRASCGTTTTPSASRG